MADDGERVEDDSFVYRYLRYSIENIYSYFSNVKSDIFFRLE
jgi:hypothetical protein